MTKPSSNKARAAWILTAAVLGLTACSSPPKPAHPDGTARVPVNDMTRIDRLRQQSASEQSLVAERQTLKDEIALLRSQIETLRKALQVIVNQPEAADAIRQAYPQSSAPQAAPDPAPALSSAAPVPPERRSSSDTTVRLIGGPPGVDTIDEGLVFRFFHASGDARFDPDPNVIEPLLAAARQATQIVVWGRTDSAVRDETSEKLAISRAVHARTWLVANGIDATRIRVRYTSTGHFLADNTTDEGRALNRRVEIETRGIDRKDIQPTKG